MNKIKSGRKLMFKISFLVGAATLLILIGAGSSLNYLAGNILRDSLRKNGLQTARQAMDKIDRVLYERYLDIQGIAGERVFQDELSDAPGDRLNHHLNRLRDLAVVSGPWNALFVIDPRGVIVLSTTEDEIGATIAPWYYKNIAFEKALKGEVVYSDFSILKHTGEPTVIFAAPIRDNANPGKPVIGAVVGDLAWSSVREILDNITDQGVLLLNSAGAVIARNTAYDRTGFLIDERRGRALVDKVKKEGDHSIILNQSRNSTPRETLLSLAAQNGYLAYQGSGWILVSVEPTRAAAALINSSERMMILFISPVIVLMSAVILFMIYRIVVRPVVRLTQTVRAVSSGDLTRQAAVVSDDEVGQLAAAFNDMTGKLRKSYEDLEAQVARRTRELDHSREDARLIIAAANDAFVSMDENGRITDWNRGAENILGWSRAEAIGRPVAETIIPRQYREKHSQGLSRFVRTGEGVVTGKTLELSALHRDGHEFPIEITIWSIQETERRQFHAFIRDISERKKTEEELHKTYRELERREAASRDAFLDLQKSHEELKQLQTQLVQSEKLASIGQLAAGVAHEINNPVGFIKNNMDVLEQYITAYGQILRMVDNLKTALGQENWEKARLAAKEMDEFEKEIDLDYIINDIDKLLQHNQRGLERVQKIVMDLSTFAREDKDSMELVKMEEVIDSILSIVYNELKYKAVLKKDYGETSLVRCNAQRLGQVFINLLMNAVQAIEEQGTIGVKSCIRGKFVCVEVSDTGKGIEEKNLKKIFDPFFTTKPAGQGTGLGLSVSYEIVKKYGGEIKVQSRPGEGTTFTVMMPVT